MIIAEGHHLEVLTEHYSLLILYLSYPIAILLQVLTQRLDLVLLLLQDEISLRLLILKILVQCQRQGKVELEVHLAGILARTLVDKLRHIDFHFQGVVRIIALGLLLLAKYVL